ncbi:MAG: tryptophan--tRNA ligase [Gemmatimonadota bacterium]|nr:tryptophan--tRNA ligase [Gemmatimonadota bacterium]MDH3426910.1 tryptophan--tRNA ligase [Gemmatimonadota bacterium]
MSQGKPRILSGIQPSGEMHIGNYLGAVRNWVDLLDDYDGFYCIVDLHAITVQYDPRDLEQRVLDLAVGLLASGLDPERCTLFVQSSVPEHTELQWLLGTVTPLGELQRMTQFKDKSRDAESVNAGLLTYPVLQAADILLYLGERVPVGEDQRQHLELTREIARRWNARFGQVFPEPQPLILPHGKRILGLDGATKMSKSQGNTIPLLAEPDELHSLVRTAVTDPARVRKDDPGNPHVCNVFALHGHFSSSAERDDIEILCQTAGIGCVDCKNRLADNLAETLAPVRERARELADRPERVRQILAAGTASARSVARETIAEVRQRMGLSTSPS